MNLQRVILIKCSASWTLLLVCKVTSYTLYLTVTSWWARWHLKSPASRVFSHPFIQAQIKENINAPRHWPLCGESPHERPVTRKMFPFDDVIMWWIVRLTGHCCLFAKSRPILCKNECFCRLIQRPNIYSVTQLRLPYDWYDCLLSPTLLNYRFRVLFLVAIFLLFIKTTRTRPPILHGI